MSVDQTNIVDSLGIDSETREVVLIISDHLDWTGGDKDKEHLMLLQKKINTYLRFIESGEYLTAIPIAKKDMKVKIDIVQKHDPNENALNFYHEVRRIVESAGIGFTFQRLHTLQ